MDKCKLIREKSTSTDAAIQYNLDLNRRVTDKIYADAGVAPLDSGKWSRLERSIGVATLGVALLRRACRFIAPPLMNWGVAIDNSKVKAELKQQDEKECLAKK